jgi:CDP-glucose 4,6-dehydratase
METYSTNVMGTVNLFEAAKTCKSVKVVVNVTTDKVYENVNQIWGYREIDPLGGHDPYSSSKACSDLITSAYSRSFFHANGVGIASARAGNVIGGGDWSKDRLVPDILRAIKYKTPLKIRFPMATRPWQHVIEPVVGYLQLAEKLFEEPTKYSSAWNFGPSRLNNKSVSYIMDQLLEISNSDIKVICDSDDQPHEANLLCLDVSKSIDKLCWKPQWDITTALEKVVSWHDAFNSGQKNMFEVTSKQINEYLN